MNLDWHGVVTKVKEIRSDKEPLCAYIYDLNHLMKHAASIRSSLPENFDFFYAIKANSDLPVLLTLVDLVDGFEASSGGEIAWIRRHFPKIPLIFSGPGKLDSELELAVTHDVTIHVESQHELERLLVIARDFKKTASILLRINPQMGELKATSLMMGGKPSQFGIGTEFLPDCMELIKQNEDSFAFKGFHFHLLSHQLEPEQHLLLLAAYIKQAKEWCEKFGLPAQQINVGGGIGINYRNPENQFDWDVFAQGLNQLSKELAEFSSDHFNARIRFELGRFVTGFCGFYAAEVIDIKTSGGKAFAVLRGGTHHFRTPYAQGHSHPFQVVHVDSWNKSYSRPGIQACKVNLVGQLCTPKDMLATDAMVEALNVGDIILFSHAGAYAWHISHHDFLRHSYPQHIYLPVSNN